MKDLESLDKIELENMMSRIIKGKILSEQDIGLLQGYTFKIKAVMGKGLIFFVS
jgi:hypothetical protein